MDPSNPDDWRKLATAFTSAPVWAVMVATGVTVGAAVWWFRGWMSEAQIAGLKAEMAGKVAGLEGEKSVLEQQLKLATDGLGRARDDLVNLQKELQNYQTEVAIEGSKASPAKVDAAIVKVTRDNAEIRKKLFDALMRAHKKIDLPRGTGYPDPNE
jgi:hypothetical protein